MLVRFILTLASFSLLLWLPSAYGQFTIPADVSVRMTAAPTTGLVTGEPFVITLSVTNHGPDPVDFMVLISTDFQEEFDSSVASNDCSGLAVVVSDGKSYHYNFWWFPTSEGVLEVGATHVCHITLGLSPFAPDIFEFGFAIPEFFEELDPSNNSASVTLRRVAATQLPVLSPTSLLVLLIALILLGAWAARPIPRPELHFECHEVRKPPKIPRKGNADQVAR